MCALLDPSETVITWLLPFAPPTVIEQLVLDVLQPELPAPETVTVYGAVPPVHWTLIVFASMPPPRSSPSLGSVMVMSWGLPPPPPVKFSVLLSVALYNTLSVTVAVTVYEPLEGTVYVIEILS